MTTDRFIEALAALPCEWELGLGNEIRQKGTERWPLVAVAKWKHPVRSLLVGRVDSGAAGRILGMDPNDVADVERASMRAWGYMPALADRLLNACRLTVPASVARHQPLER
jgi:hypothetical protein